MVDTNRLRIGLASLNQTPLDWPGNLARIRTAWNQARGLGVRLLCFPELAISGYGCEDSFLHPDTARRSWQHLLELAADCGDEVALVGLPFDIEGKLYNGIAVLNRGEVRGITLKCNLAREGIHYEPRWFRAWPLGNKQLLEIDGRSVAVGNLVYSVAGLVFGIEICEDAWVRDSERPGLLYSGVNILFNGSASHFSLGKADIRERIVTDSSKRFDMAYAYTNLVGCESGRAIYDGEMLIADSGRIVARSDRLYLDDVHVLAYDFPFGAGKGASDIKLKIDADEMDLDQVERLPPLLDLPRSAASAEVEFGRAATLALFDYMRKSRQRGFVLSLSGGVDSSTVATLVWIMAGRILRELTIEERRQKLDYFAGLDLDCTVESLTGQLLTTVYQATRNSSQITRNAAAKLAHAIGSRHLELDVDALVEGYKSLIGEAIERNLTWERDDIALQNVQARVRGPGVWMLANISGALLLSTSNRSEVAVGYATMDGDTCGGLAPIAGVEKTFLRHWLNLVETGAVDEVPALAALGLVNRQEPTAELRPLQRAQRDEADLMPYEVLDALEEALIAERKTPIESFRMVSGIFAAEYSAEQIFEWTRKFCRMFAMSQWKRERYAPAFHLDDRNLDPKTWARYPILSGAFEEELRELEGDFRADRGT